MEAGFRGSAPSQGYFPQVSGFRICVDRSREEGARIVSLQVPGSDGDWHEVEPDIDYSLVVTDYVYGGGDGYEIPPEPETTPPASELKYLVLDAIMREQAAGKKVGVPVDPANPRIVILASPELTCWP
jgi:2',3'-cyclic-nucleotide 2'-phosphodiesterase (5'-nucleotidase family)